MKVKLGQTNRLSGRAKELEDMQEELGAEQKMER